MQNVKKIFQNLDHDSDPELLLSPVCDSGIQKLKTHHENINIML